MRLLLGLLAYLVAVVVIGSGAVTVLFSAPEPSPRTAMARQETTTTTSARMQALLERKAEGVTSAVKERAAALADRERADALRAKLAATPEPYVAPRANPPVERAAANAPAARAKESARREARRRTRDFEVHTAYGYAPEPRRPSYPDQFLTMRDRASP